MSDVARRCGVSVKTVSRVVNNLAGASPETTARILAAIDELGFRRNDLAMDLRQARATSTIGLLIEDAANPFYGPLIRAVEERAWQEGALVVTVSSNEDGDRERDLIQALCARRIAGLLIVTATSDHAFLAPEVQRGLPVVFVDRPSQGLESDCVLLDNARSARTAVEHLIRQGHRRVALVGDHAHVYTVQERVRGYREALAAHGIEPDESLICLGRHLAPEASAAVHELFVLPDPPTAVFATNNRGTAGVLRALRDRRVLAAVVGFDDFEFADMLVPAATVVWSDPAEMGQAAADRLFHRMSGDDSPPQRIVLPTRLLIRGSGEIRP
jgi:LacI family transcriptional regulator